VSEELENQTIEEQNAQVRREMARLSRRSFLWAGVATLGVWKGISWLASRADDDGVPYPFRAALAFNEGLAKDYFGPERLAPTFSESQVMRPPRYNGDDGLGDDFDPDQWTLTVNNVHGKGGPITLSMEDIKKLPEVTQITQFCCIEGWSMIVKWTGVRLVDFMEKYPPQSRLTDDEGNHLKPDVRRKPEDLVRYVGMSTPDDGYYVGLDMASALHPQTLLCYAMNDEPLTLEHGAPLRLVIPVKYGVKNIKRIGAITYSDDRPNDFWAKQGYDWFAGL